MEKIIKIINNVLENSGKPKINKIDKNLSLRDDLGFDSLDLAELTVNCEIEYDTDIFEDGIVVSIGDLLQKIYK